MSLRGTRVLIGAIAVAVALAALCIVGVQQLDPGQGGALDRKASLAVETPDAATPASEYSFDSLVALADVMHIDDGTGRDLSLDDIPADAYSGFIFETQGGELSEPLAAAVEAGTVTQIHGNIYSIESLDELAAIAQLDELAYVEPDFNMHLIGEIDDTTDTVTASDGFAAFQQAGASISGDTVDAVFSLFGGTTANPAPDYPPTDPEYVAGAQWNLDMLNVEGAWAAGLDGDPYVYNGKPLRDTNVRVAVIDTGLYGTGETEDQHEDLDYTKMFSGTNFVTTAAGTPDAHGHGTFVAGLIAAKTSNGVGIAGAQPGVEIVSEKVFDTGSASTEDVISAIYAAVDEDGADVINMSLGGEYNERSLEVACNYAVDQGVLVVASAGNDGVTTPNYPAAYDSVVGVASVNSDQIRSTWSQMGKSVFVTAPGENVTSTFTGASDSYKTASGTSFSGPEVAALAAMCKSVYPDIDQDTFKQFLIDTSTDLGARGYDDRYGWGLVDFTKMAEAVLSSQVLPWYNVSFSITDEDGRAIDIADAAITVAAAEDIAWDADASADPAIDEAGSWPEGTPIAPEEDGAFRLHRGNYSYRVVVDGKYTMTGAFKTYAETQVVSVKMPAAYEVTVNVVDSSGAAVEGATHGIASRDGRVETPKAGAAASAQAVYDLASGIYTYEASASGYEASAGTFTVQHAAMGIDSVLYRSDELVSVDFSVTATDTGSTVPGATVTVTDASGVTIAPQSGGVWRLAKGATYTATASKAGFESSSTTFTVGEEAEQHVALSVVCASNLITFEVIDESGHAIAGATAKVADEEGESVDPMPANGLQFALVEGDYTYEVTAPGYSVKTGSFGVALDSYTITVELEAIPSTVTFEVVDAQTHDAIDDPTIKVNLSDRLRAIEPNTPNTYLLAPADYDYTVYKEGYKIAQGTFTVAGEDMTVTVELEAQAEGAGYAGGSGTEDDPYLIANEDQLRYLAEQTELVRVTSTSAPTNKKETLTGCFHLIDDIELDGGEWLPIGNYENGSNWVAFGGEFDGGGHTISGLQISESTYDYQGLFGYARGAYIHDVVVDGDIYVEAKSSTSGGSYVGGIVGGVYAANDPLYTSGNTPPTTIERCGNLADITGRYAIGGIVGSAQGATPSTGVPDGAPDEALITVRDCWNRGDLHAMVNGDYMREAGVLGQVAAGKRAGGITGSAQYALIENCYNAGEIHTGESTGGIAGYANLTTIRSCYNSGLLMQYSDKSGEGGKTGAATGACVRTSIEHAWGMNRSDNYANIMVGTPGAYVTQTDAAMIAHLTMYRTQSFVDTLNANAVSEGASKVFALGHDYPMLYWEVTEGVTPARMPVIIEHPAVMDEADAYVQGDEAQALTAAIEDIPAEDGTVTWQWFVSDTGSFKDATPAPAGIGSGMRASYVPSTDETGAKYYFCVFTNRLGLDLVSDEASATTNAGVVYVRGPEPAATPVISKLNPSTSNDFNLNLTVKQGTDLQLSVTATVDDGGELAYQWYYSATGSGTGTAVEGATSPTYRVSTAGLGTGYYYVEVTNTIGPGNIARTLSDWITVTVDPYTISNYQELASFRTAVNSGNSFEGQIVYLLDDIAIPEGVDWTPIGTSEHPFAGTFMGGTGYAGSTPETVVTHGITGLSIDGDAHDKDKLGLFGVISGATICDVQVGGTITGAGNTNAGLLVGQAMANGTTASSIENCGTLAGSSVEGAYEIGGLIGYGGAAVANCANHADVHARAYAGSLGSGTITADSKYAVGGVSGYQNSGTMLGCYNTGTITVDAPSADDGTVCATRVGGVAGATGYYSGLASCYNAGALEVATVATSQYERGALYIGSVAGYLNSANGVNNYYMEGTWERGTDGSDHIEAAEMRSAQFMKTSYFTELLNTGTGSYGYNQFRDSANGVPHLVWEDDNTSDDAISSAEPYITNITSEDFPNITSTFAGAYFQNLPGDPIIVWADTPDGGAMRYEWRMRPAGADDDAWEVVASGSMEPDADGKNAQAPVMVDVSTIGTFEYVCEVYNKRADANTEPLEESMYIPAITITVKDASGCLTLRDPEAANSKDNPWVIDTPAKMKFFADVVNGDEVYRPISDPTFAGQYVELEADIDISGYAPWTPVGSNTSTYNPTAGVFKGTFDGGNHTIEGLTIVNPARTDYNGLFGQARMATIRNLEVAGTVTLDSGSAYGTGGIVGYAYGCFVENVVNRVDVTGAANTGGIIGYAGTCKILDCENLGSVSMNREFMDGKYGGRDAGGIAGFMFISSGVEGAGIYNCFNNGTVTGNLYDGDYRIGAILGGAGSGFSASSNLAHNYYRAGSIVVEGADIAGTGFGGGSYEPVADAAGVCMAIADTNSPETAYALDTSDGTAERSGRWSNFARADIGDTASCVHLVLGHDDEMTFHIDTASEAAAITASAEYAKPGDEVAVSWESKPGFTVGKVSWRIVGSDELHELGTGAASAEPVAFTMPEGDVEFVVEYEQDTAHRYAIATDVLLDGETAPAEAGSVAIESSGDGTELAGGTVGIALAIADGYQVGSVTVADAFGNEAEVARVDGTHYTFAMPAADVTVTVNLEAAGTPAAARAASLTVDTAATHVGSSDERYRTPNLLYDTVAFSGAFLADTIHLGHYYGGELPRMAYQLERSLGSLPALYTQDYTVLGQGTHRYTGTDLAALIEVLADAPVPADTAVLIESADGSSYACTFGDLSPLLYSSYDETGQPDTRGLPVLLYYGVDGTPNENGAMGVVFGQKTAGDDNAARIVTDVTRICVGDDVNFSQHVWGNEYIDYEDMDAIAGGKANDEAGYTNLTVRVYRGADNTGELVSEQVLSLPEIEQMARTDRAGIQHGWYSTMLYENRDSASDGPYCDYYEGYDLWKVLKAAGVPYEPEGTVQFYQTGSRGLANSWKTIDVSLAYVAGNGDGGEGDYSNNAMTYVTGVDSTSPVGSGTITGLKPMLVYGKNGLPLVWSSGTDQFGYTYGMYNYRGPMMAFLPQNEVEGGSHVGTQTATSCYLGLIEVYLPGEAPADVDKSALEAAIAAAQGDLDETLVSADGSDVADGTAYATQATADELIAAIEAAQAVLDDDAATQADVDAAVEAVADAQAAFDNAKQEASVDRMALASAVIKAQDSILDAPQASEDGNDVADGDTYVPAETLQALEDAVDEARAVLADPEATQADIDGALQALEDAKAAYGAAVTTASVARGALEAAIAAAKAAESGVATSTDGSDAGDRKWTTAAEKSALDKAIAAAQKVAGDARATQAQVDKAAKTISGATSTYNGSKKIWHRIWGKTAPDTMKAIADRFGKAKVAIVTTDASYKDALAASALAGKNNAIVLMTKKGSLTAQTKQALQASGVSTVYIVGSTSDVTTATQNAIKKVSGVKNVWRVNGSSASAKAINVAKKTGKASDTVIIATQNGFEDALSIAPYSYVTKSPILYAETSKKLSSATTAYIKSAGYKKAIVVGGPIALPASIDSQLKSAGVTQVTRLAGANSYATSDLIAKWSTGKLSNKSYGTYKGKALAYVKFQPSTKMSADRLAVSTGQNWLDALAGAALCGKNRSVLLLADAKTAKSNYTLAPAFCKSNKASIKTAAYVFGGTSAVSPAVWNALVASTK